MKEMDPSGASNLCWPGCGQVLTHMLHCPEVISFWEDVVHTMSLREKGGEKNSPFVLLFACWDIGMNVQLMAKKDRA